MSVIACRSLARILTLAASCLGSVSAAPAAGPTGAFELLVHDYYERFLATHPERATQLGDHRFDRKSADLSAAGVQADRALYRGTLTALEAIPASGLTPDDAVDRDILETDLRSRLFDLEELSVWQWQVTNYAPVRGAYVLVARDAAPMKERLSAVKERLAAVPSVIKAAKENLVHPPRVYTETAIAQNKGAIAFVQDDLERLVQQEPSMRAALAKPRDEAIAALRAYGVWLERDLLPRSDGDFRLGREHFEQRLRFALDTDLSANDVLAQAQADVKSTQAALEEMAIPLFQRYFPQRPIEGLDKRTLVRVVLDRIAETHPNADTIVSEARTDVEDATAFVRAHDFVSVSTEPIRVIEMPEFRRGAAVAYCDAPGPLEKHGQTLYAISPPPAVWSPQQVVSHFREYNSAALKVITAHEAMPGHYLQFTHANALHYRTLVRPMTGSGSFSEGWADYASDLMVGAGFGGDEVRMESLKLRLRVDINAILDHRIHVDGMSEQEAMRLMMEDGYQEEGEAAGKWRRAQMSAGQLSTYFVGGLEVTSLARDLRSRTGGNIKAAHDAMLSHGSIATKYVRRLERLPVEAERHDVDIAH